MVTGVAYIFYYCPYITMNFVTIVTISVAKHTIDQGRSQDTSMGRMTGEVLSA
jgi:hypothetical protein